MARELGPRAMFVAGGTDLYPKLKRRQFEIEALIGLDFLDRRVDTETIGAGATLADVASHVGVPRGYGQAAGHVSSPPLRNAGTAGGNLCVDTRCNYYDMTYEWRKAIGFCLKKDGDICLVAPGSPRCWAVSSSDTAPVAWSLGAKVRLVGPSGERVIPVQELFRDDGMDPYTTARDEILTEIILPPADGWRSIYLQLRRRGSC